MADKEQIIVDGVDVKDCRRRIGKNSYCRYFKRLCSENNFNCVWKQLARKTQECEELRKTVLTKCPECGSEYLTPAGLVLFMEADHYRRALEEIEAVCRADTYTFADGAQVRYDSLDDILDIINKAKGEMNG